MDFLTRLMAPAHDGPIVISPAADAGSSAMASQLVSSRPVDIDWDAVDTMRARDYSRLDALDQTYLDYTGGGLYAESQLREHHELLRAGLFGNPHSSNPASRTSTQFADAARRAILAFVNASPDDYTVVFTANASGALKLVGEAFPFTPGSRYLLTTDNHNSVNGIREFARSRDAEVTYLPLHRPELRQDEAELLAALDRAPAGPRHLFAYPAQSNYSGVRHPLAWVELAQERGWDVLLDSAAFLPTNRLDLSKVEAGLRRRVLVQGLRLPDRDRLADRPSRGARAAAPAVVRRRDHRRGVRRGAAQHLGRRRDGLRGRHRRLPRAARHRDRIGPCDVGRRR